MRSLLKLMRFGLLPLGMGMLLLMHLLVALTVNPFEFGLFSLLLTATSISGLIMSAGIPLTAQKYVSAFLGVKDDESFHQYAGFLLLWLASVVLLLMVSLPVFSHIFQLFLVDVPVFIVPLLIFSVCVWLLQRNVCLGSGYQGWAIFPRDILAPLGTIIFIVFQKDTDAVQILTVFALVSIFSCLVVLWSIIQHLKIRTQLAFKLPNFSLAKSWLLSARAFLFIGLLQLGMNGWDIIILGIYVGLEETGKYALAIKVASVVMILVRLANTFAGNRFANLHARELYAENYQYYVRICQLSVVGALVIVLVFLSSMPFWSAWFGSEFADAKWLVVVLMMTNALIACFGPSLAYLNMTGMEQTASREVLLWSLVSIVCNFALIPFIGVQGALISYVLSNLGLRLRLFSVLAKNQKTVLARD